MMIHDQTTDRSGAELVKIASRLEDRGLAEYALNTLFSMKRLMKKEASFPVDTPENVVLSRIYFEGQRDAMTKEAAEAIDGRLGVHETLYGMDIDTSFVETPEPVRLSPDHAFELLPNVKVASDADFVQAGEDFSHRFHEMPQRRALRFAAAYDGLAKSAGLESVEIVELMSGDDAVPNEAMADNVLLRKAAMERAGRNGSAYAELHRMLMDCDAREMPVADLRKLACTLDSADRANGLAGRRGLPDAWHSLLRVKTAEEADASAKADAMKSLDKADIIGRYGDGVLEEVEDPVTGKIDHDRLKEIVRELRLDHSEDNDHSDDGDDLK